MTRRALPLLLALPLVACLPDDQGEPVPTQTLTLSGLSDGLPRWVDFQAEDGRGAEAGWDLRAEGWNLFLNGGESGEARGGGIDMALLDLELRFEDMRRRNQVVSFFFFDSYACALSDWWHYALDGTHTLFSNHHNYVVRRGERDFVVQVLDYYRVVEGEAQAGHVDIRWAEVPEQAGAPFDVVYEEIDATAGGVAPDPNDPDDKWTYYSFDDGVVDLSDEAALASTGWDLGFKRFNIKSNSGPSGPGGVVTTDPDIDRGETPAEVLAMTPDSELPGFLAAVEAWDPSGDHAFREDAVQPVVRRWYTGRPGRPDDPPLLNEGKWFLVSDRSGAELLKLRVIAVEGEDEAGPDSVTLEWGLLP